LLEGSFNVVAPERQRLMASNARPVAVGGE
jgi:hypothetical protein